MLNLAGADASHSKSNYHLSEEKARPGIHGLGQALCTTTDGWERPAPPPCGWERLGKGETGVQGWRNREEAAGQWAVGMTGGFTVSQLLRWTNALMHWPH